MSTRFVIIGGNIAGTTLAESLRKENQDVQITLIERDHNPCYSRVLLPHYVKDKIPREKVFMKTLAWYGEHNIEFMHGVEALSIDATNRFVATSEGREIPYDKLIITTGGEVSTLPLPQREVAYFRGIEDADQIKTFISELLLAPEGERRMLVYGGGFIAMEFINFCKHFGLDCDVAMRSSGFWSKVISQGAQAILQKQVEASGFRMTTGVEIKALLGGDHVKGAVLSNGDDLPVSMVGVGIGIQPETHLFEGMGLTMGKTGIITNNYFETNVEHVYAIGDIAEFEDIMVGRTLGYGNWMNAQMQARVLAKTLTGTRTPFELVSSYSTNLLGKELVFIGDTSREHAKVRQLELTDDVSVEIFDRDDRTVGATLIGDVSKRAMITKAIKEQSYYV